MLWGVAASRGNMIRGLLNAIVILVLILCTGHEPRPPHHRARAHGWLRTPRAIAGAQRYTQWSGVALGSHVVPWIVLQLFRKQTMLVGIASALGFGLVWFWVRNEVREQYAAEIAAAAKAREESAEEPSE